MTGILGIRQEGLAAVTDQNRHSIIADSVKEHFQFLFKHGNVLFMIQLCLVEQLVLHDYKYTPNKYRIGQDAEHSNHKYDPLCYALTVKPVF